MSKVFACAFAMFCVAATLGGAPARADSGGVNCDHGPIPRTFGGLPWLVYGCNVDHEIIVVATKDNPAAPYYFVIRPDAAGFVVQGGGGGNKDATDAAYQELRRLTGADIDAILYQARHPEGIDRSI